MPPIKTTNIYSPSLQSGSILSKGKKPQRQLLLRKSCELTETDGFFLTCLQKMFLFECLMFKTNCYDKNAKFDGLTPKKKTIIKPNGFCII